MQNNYKIKKLLILLFLLVFGVSFNANAQGFLTHNTSTLSASVYENGNVGHLGGGGTGADGIKYSGGADAMYASGVIFGTKAQSAVNGQLGSFNVNSDLVNVVPISGFSSNSDFDEIATAQFNDSGAPNPYGLTITQTTSSNIPDTIVFVKYELSGASSALDSLYIGMFADWDIGGTNYRLNLGGYDSLRGMAYEYGSAGNTDLNYYGIVALDGMSGARVTSDNSTSNIRSLSFDRLTSFLNEQITSPTDYRMWIGSGPFNLQPGGSVQANFAVIAAQNLQGLQNCADIAIAKYQSSLPVELTSFTAEISGSNVLLEWHTATEVNNYGFDVERSNNNSDWSNIGFIPGNGNSNSPKEYSFADNTVNRNGKYFYRLKQIDNDGKYEYSAAVEINFEKFTKFELEQNFPNPFNPVTKIKFTLLESGFVKLNIINALGEIVEELINNNFEAGSYNVDFNAGNLPSGIYYYQLRVRDKVKTKKMILLK